MKDDDDGNRRRNEKKRPIAFCAHSDAHVFAYYGRDLEQRLEALYSQDVGASILAYRKFNPARCNVHFAAEAFRELTVGDGVDVIAFDVEGFFDSLDHLVLKRAWAQLLGEATLPSDHYAVFKACTKDYAVLLPSLRDAFEGEVRRRAGHGSTAICTPSEFRKKVVPLLQPRHELVAITKRKGKAKPSPAPVAPCGIAQGLPISAVLANVYMYETDVAICSAIARIGGSYRRYSDDIFVVVPAGSAAQAEQVVIDELVKVGLSLNAKKTERCRFASAMGALTSVALDDQGQPRAACPSSYLGLSFDGAHIRIKAATISRFLVKARRAIARAKLAAERHGTGRIKRRQLYARLTSLGYGKAYGPYVHTTRRPRNSPQLGFFNYIKLAERVTGSATIARQRRQLENMVFRWLNDTDVALQSA